MGKFAEAVQSHRKNLRIATDKRNDRPLREKAKRDLREDFDAILAAIDDDFDEEDTLQWELVKVEEERQLDDPPKEYAKIVDCITIPNLPPDNSVDVVLLFRYDEVKLRIGNAVWTWRGRKWEKGVDCASDKT